MKTSIKNKRGASMLEFVIAMPILLLLVLGIIDLFSYLYLGNILEARAHRALEVASWVPSLSESRLQSGGNEQEPPTNNPNFIKAKQRVISAAFDGEISSLFTTDIAGGKRAKLMPETESIIEKYIEDTEEMNEDVLSEGDNSRIALILPKVDESTGNRDAGFARQPIGVRINAEINPLLPFLPAIKLKGEAWGFREDYTYAGKIPMFDCLGRAFNENNLPSPEQCDCGGRGINPKTGQCGCPEGTIWGRRPDRTEDSCICDFSTKGCHEGQKLDYDNCSCGVNCPSGTTDNWGQRRTEDNQCACTSISGYIKETTTCKKNVCEMIDGVEVCKDITTGCSNSNCPAGMSYSSEFCGCWCTNRNAMITTDPNQPNAVPPQYVYMKQFSVEGAAFTDPEQACKPLTCSQDGLPPNYVRSLPYCICYSTLVPPEPYVDANGFIRQHGSDQNCQYECKSRTWARHEIVNGKCQCKAGYIPAKNVYNGDEPVDCCPAATCTLPNEEVYVGNNASTQRACMCRCLPGYVRDTGTGECITLEESEKEGTGG